MKRSIGMVVVSLLVQGLWAHASRLCAWTYQTNGIPGTAAAQAVALSTSGDVFVGGYLGNPNDRASVVVRLSGTKGTEQWRQEFVGSYGDTADALAVDGDGGLIVAGRFQGRFAIRKLSQRDGSSLWIRKIDGSAEDSGLATAVTIDSAGDVFAVGWITDAGTFADICVVKLSGADGAELWRHVIDGPTSREDYGYALALGLSGEVIMTGEVMDRTSALGFHPDHITVALSPESGRELWRYFGGYGGGASVQTDLTGDIFVTGWRGFGQTIDSSGTRISGTTLDERTGSELWSNSIEGDVGDGVGALDAAGDLVVGGTRLSRQDNTWEFVVGKFSGASGVLQWVRTPFGATRGFQSAAAVCVDRAGSSVTVGTAFAGSNGRDFTLVKHSGAGQEMWHRAITGGGQMDDGALACVIDRSGNVIAVGYETQVSGDLDFVVVKLSGVTGEDFEPDAMTLLNLLVESVGDIDMPAGLRESLLAKLHAAALALEDPTGANSASVRGPLTALVREVEAQRGNKIAATDADGLVESARDILALLSGPA